MRSVKQLNRTLTRRYGVEGGLDSLGSNGAVASLGAGTVARLRFFAEVARSDGSDRPNKEQLKEAGRLLLDELGGAVKTRPPVMSLLGLVVGLLFLWLGTNFGFVGGALVLLGVVFALSRSEVHSSAVPTTVVVGSLALAAYTFMNLDLVMLCVPGLLLIAVALYTLSDKAYLKVLSAATLVGAVAIVLLPLFSA